MISPSATTQDERVLGLPDGRRVRLIELGRPGGRPVIGLHGTPGSRLKFRGAHAAADALGLRLIAPDRWGYGGTDAPRRPRLEDYASDLGHIADMLGLDTFALLGISGGGPFAAMAASRLAARASRTALVCPVGPLLQDGATQAGLFHRFVFRVLPRIPGAIPAAFAAYRAAVMRMPDAAVGIALARAPAADREVMAEPVLRRALAETFAAGLADGTAGPRIDMELFSRDWRVDPATAGTARVWIGTHDRNVPLPAARGLARQLGAEIVEIDGAGHYWIAQAWPDVLRWLSTG